MKHPCFGREATKAFLLQQSILESRDCTCLKVSTWWLATSGSPRSHTVLLETCALTSTHLKTAHVKRQHTCSLATSSQTRGGKIFVFVFPFSLATNQMGATCTLIHRSRKSSVFQCSLAVLLAPATLEREPQFVPANTLRGTAGAAKRAKASTPCSNKRRTSCSCSWL